MEDAPKPSQQSQLSQPLLVCQVLPSLNYHHGPLLESVRFVHVCLVLGSPEGDTVTPSVAPLVVSRTAVAGNHIGDV